MPNRLNITKPCFLMALSLKTPLLSISTCSFRVYNSLTPKNTLYFNIKPFSLKFSHPYISTVRCCNNNNNREGQNGKIDMSKYKEAFNRRMELAGLKPNHRIALGVSGGPDSMALCVLASSWKTNGNIDVNRNETGFIDDLLAIVVDHGLRAESKEEACSVSRRVLDMGISCEIAHCEWSEGKPMKGHLQEAARDRRYQIFRDICVQHQIGVLLVAHHADDQAELFIIRLSRNSGVLGLAGMAFTSQLYSADPDFYGEGSSSSGILLVRPLLEFSKDDMYQICQGANQEWVEDPSNQSPAYARNRIRLALKELSSSKFDRDVQAVISACRRTRTYVDHICCNLIDQTVSIMPQGYAVIDLALLNPRKVEDLCLSKFITLLLQFISQKHRPVRTNALNQLLHYFRNVPCKGSFTAAGCYVCPAPGSKGTKILICCSSHFTSPSEKDVLLRLLYGQKHLSTNDISQNMDSNLPVIPWIPDASTVHFLNVNSIQSLLVEAKRLNILSEFTFENINSIQKDETEKFRSVTVEGSVDKLKSEVKTVGFSSSETLPQGVVGYFMNRFLVKWERTDNSDLNKRGANRSSYCVSCMLGYYDAASVRHMVDADWLYLAELCRDHHLKDSEQQFIKKTNVCNDYAHLSAQKALMQLKSIPVAARRGLPVLENPQGQLISILGIGFKHCPCLTVSADFRPRVPLGGGHSSFIEY